MTSTAQRPHTDDAKPSGGTIGKLVFAWGLVGIPLAYGVIETARKASALFTG